MLAKAMKYSKQREALLELLHQTKTHPTADWIYHELRKTFPSISLATVYRNLKQLAQSGDIIRLETGLGSEHYDACTENHYHFICSHCGRISDLKLEPFSSMNKLAEESSGCRIEKHSLVFYGVCAECEAVNK